MIDRKLNETFERIEWGELWPDGVFRPVHHNATPVGRPDRPPPYAHRGTKWACRKITCAPWVEWTGELR